MSSLQTPGGRAPSGKSVIDNLRELESAVFDWFHRETQARIMVDLDLRALWQNDAFAELSALRQEVEITDNVVTAVDRAQQPGLLRFVREASATLSTWRLPRAGQRGFLLLRAAQLSHDKVGLIAVRTGPDCKQEFAGLDHAFKLTASEHRVLIGLLEGDDADTLARRYNVALDTTRTHIRNLYAKMGVNSRESLFALALPFRL